ncbi:PAX [Parelaphostrongylus tenuis]|uniref:PAX n=1 Tax=Parelaphostrongylus tenuis TaxID=148309 RepID=A0AAD5M7I6_PARTN|nr:PAX [Parelaphostrongylus tenuis]
MEGSQCFKAQPSGICISLPPVESSISSRKLLENKEVYLAICDKNENLSHGTIEEGRNQLGRTYSPGLPLSMCEREEIVKLFQKLKTGSLVGLKQMRMTEMVSLLVG